MKSAAVGEGAAAQRYGYRRRVAGDRVSILIFYRNPDGGRDRRAPAVVFEGPVMKTNWLGAAGSIVNEELLAPVSKPSAAARS